MPTAATALPRRLWTFYADGFREMTVGRRLWLIIIIKLVVIFAILRLFFLRPAHAGLSTAEKERAVATRLTTPAH